MALYYIPQFRTTTLATVGGIDASQTTDIEIADVPADLDIAVPGIICVSYSNPLVIASAEFITYTSINGSNILQGVARGAEGYSAKAHSLGVTIAWVVSKSHINNVNDLLNGVTAGIRAKTALYDVNGLELIKFTATASAVNELTIANAATGAFPTISATGEADTGIDFENSEGEEILKLDAIASAVNEITIKNAATGSNPSIEVTGGDENISLTLTAKGTGKLLFDAHYQTPQTYTPDAAATATLDLSTGNEHRITMPAGNITIAISNEVSGQKFIVSLLQDGTGSRTVTWFSTIRWAGGSAPTLTTTASKRDVFGFICTGTDTYDGFIVGMNI